MTCYIRSWCDKAPSFASKKVLKEIVTKGNGSLVITDPSIVNPRDFRVDSLKPGEEVVVTNHPKRSWFAQVGRKADGTLYVK